MNFCLEPSICLGIYFYFLISDNAESLNQNFGHGLLTVKLYFHLHNIEGSHCTAGSILVVLLAKPHYCLEEELPLNLYWLMIIYSCWKFSCAYKTDAGKDSLMGLSVCDQLSYILTNFICFFSFYCSNVRLHLSL